MTKNTDIVAVFVGGGTGGHIYPGLAICDEFRSLCKKNNRSVKICWIGNSSGMDKNIVEKNLSVDGQKSADIFYGIPSGKLRRYFSIQNFFDVFKIISGCIFSFFLLIRIKPNFVFSKGGFVSVPPCFCARLLKIPVFTHECDFTPGLATRINAKSASKILLSYQDTCNFFSQAIQKKVVVTGNPVRSVFYNVSEKIALDFLNISEKPKKPVLFICGGSLGAKQINDLVYENFLWLCEHFFVIHQTGQKNQAEKQFENPDYRAFPFIYTEMSHVMAFADIILSRAGANSIWECAVLNKPMILIPLCGSGTRGDQEDNAKFFEEKGGALVLARENANGEMLKKSLQKMLDENERKKCAEFLKNLTNGEKPAEKISNLLYNVVKT